MTEVIADFRAHYHLPGLFEFYEFYKIFLELYRSHREYFYDWCDIGSIYGAPSDCIWAGGRVETEICNPEEAIKLANEYDISVRLCFSNSLLQQEDLQDSRCNSLCRLITSDDNSVSNGIIVYSDLLLAYLKNRYPGLYYISTTTKVLTDWQDLLSEVRSENYSYVVPDFRFNRDLGKLGSLNDMEKSKLEFLCNECCSVNCMDRKACYEAVSRKNLGIDGPEHICHMPDGDKGYSFYRAMQSPAFIGIDAIRDTYMPMGFSNYKIEGRGLGSAMLLEFILYYMIKPEYQLKVREDIYLDSMLDLF